MSMYPIKEWGLVLKRLVPRSSQLPVLTKFHGKILIVTRKDNMGELLWPGTLISFYICSLRGSVHEICALEIISMPLELDSESLFFVHHMLEICYYFVALHDQCPHLFDFLCQVFFYIVPARDKSASWLRIQNLCIVKLLVLLGFYPPKPLDNDLLLFDQRVLGSVDFVKKGALKSFKDAGSNTISCSDEQIKKWISSCLVTHPNVQFFKTFDLVPRR